MTQFRKVFPGIIESLVKDAKLFIRGDGSIVGDNTGDQTDATLPFSDILTNNSSVKKHGFLKKLSGSSSEFMDGEGNWNIPSGTGVSSVTATSPITSSGGLTPVISTSMSTNKLIGRGTAGTGVMEEITLGTGLSFTGTTLNTVSSPVAATVTITNDITTDAVMYPAWVTANTGALPLYVSSTKFSFNPASTITDGLNLSSDTITTAHLLDLQITGTQADYGQTGLNIVLSGANAIASVSTYGINCLNSHTGTSSSTYGGYFQTVGGGATSTSVALEGNASGATTNYAGYFRTTGASTKNVGLYCSALGAVTNHGLIVQNGLVGIATTAPVSLFSVGASSQFQINTTGNIVLLNNVITSFPAVQGAASTFLKNDGAGNLSWTTTVNSTTITVTDDITTNSVMYPTWVTANSGNLPIKVSSTKMSFNPSTGVMTLAGDALIHTLTVGLGASSLSGNTVLGVSGLAANTTGDYNVAIGYQSLLANTSGEGTVAIGYQALKAQTIYGYNIAIGYQAMQYLQDGYNNIAIGVTALEANVSGTYNVAIGNSALVLNTLDFNTAIGTNAGGLNNGYGNVFLGYSAGYRETGNNRLYIDNAPHVSQAVARTSSLIYGVFDAVVANQSLTVNGVLNVQFASNFTGQITGNLTGNVTGNVSGTALNVTGIVLPANGGTGIANNNSSTLTISGAFGTTITVGATTSVTLPDSGTLYGTKANSITSAQLASSLTDETGTLLAVFSDSPTFTTQIIAPLIYGSSAANGDITIHGTSNATRTTSYVLLQPTDGNVGIGMSAPAAKLDITSSSTTEPSINVLQTNSSASAVNYGARIQYRTDPSSNIQTFSALRADFRYDGSTNNTETVFGPATILSVANNNSTGTIGNFSNIRLANANSMAGTITNFNGIEISAATNAGGGVITNLYGIKVKAQTLGSTLSTAYYGENAAATGRYNVYMVGTAQNYFAGLTGIGVAVPINKLDISNTTASILGLNVNSTLTGTITDGNASAVEILDVTLSSGLTNVAANVASLTLRGTENLTSAVKGAISNYIFAFNRSTAGTITNFSGQLNDLRNLSTGTIANFNGNWVGTAINSGGGAVTNFYGYRCASQTIGGTINAAFKGEIASGATSWNLYMDGTAQNYLAGNTGIGVISALGVLHLKANTATANTGAIKFSLPGVVLTTREAGVIETDAETIYYTPTSTARQAIGGTLFTQTADKTVTNTVTETTIIGTGVGSLATAMTLPTNFFNKIGKSLRLRIGGIYSTPALATPSIIIKVKFGATTIATVTTTALLSGATNLEFDGEVFITCRTTGATGTVMVHGDIEYATGVAGTIAVDPLNNAGATTTIDTTAASLLDVTVQWDTATSTRIVKSTVCSLEVLN